MPLGLATPDNYLFEIHSQEGGPLVGLVWLAIERHPAGVSGFIYDLKIRREYWRQGQASRALAAVASLNLQQPLGD